MSTTFKDLAKVINANNRSKGFYQHSDTLIESHIKNKGTLGIIDSLLKVEKLALIITELSEAIEGLRTNKIANTFEYKESDKSSENFEKYIKDTYEDEIADALIRILDFAGEYNIDLDFHVKEKLKYNKNRPYKHGKSF